MKEFSIINYMEKDFKELAGKVRTKEELISLLEEIDQKKLGRETSKLEEALRSLPEMKLEIAFLPSDDFLNRISQWLKKETDQKIILDITLNPKLGAGVIIEYRGFFRDFSLARRIDQLISQQDVRF